MRKSNVLILHVSFWGLFGLLYLMLIGFVTLSFEYSINKSQLFFILQNAMVAVFVFYIAYFSAPFYLKKKRRLCYLAVSILILAVMYSFIAKYINNNSAYLLDTVGVFTPPLILAFVAFIIRSVIELGKESLEKTEIEKESLLVQLELLKARINPHFLFNSLNNIDILIEENPKRASEYLTKLSDILRYVLYEAKDDVILLSAEIEQIKNYVELQKIRTDNARFVNLNIKGELTEQKIAAMLFMPFVENAFKHCRNKSVDNAVTIEFDIRSDVVRMVCENYYDSAKCSEILKNNGLGIEIIKQRLNLLYPESHELVIDKSEHQFNVTLNVKLKNGN